VKRLHKLPVLFALEGNPQPENEPFGRSARASQKSQFPQVTRYEQVTTENFGPDFHLTGEPLGNKIQLQSFWRLRFRRN
jgi:hypothetical protein